MEQKAFQLKQNNYFIFANFMIFISDIISKIITEIKKVITHSFVIGYPDSRKEYEKERNDKRKVTVEYIQVERVDVEAGVQVVVEEVAGSVDVRAGVGWELHFGVVSDGTVLHALRKPQELPYAVLRFKLRHLGVVPVTDVEYSAIAVHFPSRRNQAVIAVRRPNRHREGARNH